MPKAYVPGFEHDVFISYARVDNVDGWVTAFQRELENRLATRVGRLGRVRVWRDPSLDGAQVLDDVLKQRVESAAIFLALTSRGYLESTYCCDELKWFCAHAENSPHGLTISERRRAVNVLLTNLDKSEWSGELSGARGFALHDGDERDPKRIGEPTKTDTDAFDDQLRELADALYRLLEAFKERTETAPSAANGRVSVYLADTSDMLRDLRDRLGAELGRRGHRVLDDIPPPYPFAEHEDRVVSALREAALSVHLLDGHAGRKIDDAPETTYVKKQVELGLASQTPQILWVPPELDVSSVGETQRQFLESLETGTRGESGYDYVRAPQDALVGLVLEKLEELEARAPVVPKDGTSVLLDTHVKDQRYAFQIAQYLDERGVQPFFHQETDDSATAMRRFEEELARVEKLVIVFGRVSSEWVIERVNAAFQFVAKQLGRGAALQDFYVFMVPPEKKDPLPFLPVVQKTVQVLDHSARDRLDAAAVATILGAAS